MSCPASLLPTPAPSTDISPRDGSHSAGLNAEFELLPPPALASDLLAFSSSLPSLSSLSSSTPDPSVSPSLPLATAAAFQVQPSEAVKARRRPSAVAAATMVRDHPPPLPVLKEPFVLPPPPTRPRRIIHMNPRNIAAATSSSAAFTPATTATKSGSSAVRMAAVTNATAAVSGSGVAAPSSKKKPTSATSTAGRKIARKTAHSLIERRRRSKINDEFAVLKSMIPACSDEAREMHKLAILQASIEYVGYLKDCVGKLQAQQAATQHAPPVQEATLPDSQYQTPLQHEQPCDVDVIGVAITSPSAEKPLPRHLSSISPVIQAQDYGSHTEYRPSCRYLTTAVGTPQPFGPPTYGAATPTYARSIVPAAASTSTSPSLVPLGDFDHEATAALLMLNRERRNTASSSTTSAGGRGISVRDLLIP